MEQPEGYVAPGKKEWVWLLMKGLYGSVQAGITWNEELSAHMESERPTATAKDPAIYVKNPWASDDFAAAGRVAIGSGKELANLSKIVDAKYGITGPGEVKWVLSMLLERDHLPARSRSPRRYLLTPSSLASTSLTQLRSQRPSLRDPTFLWPTAPPHRTRSRKWRPPRTGSLWEHWHGLPSGLARISHSPPKRASSRVQSVIGHHGVNPPTYYNIIRTFNVPRDVKTPLVIVGGSSLGCHEWSTVGTHWVHQ